MDKITSKIGLIGLFIGTFFLFLYLSFPYGVLKEALASQIQLSTGMGVRIEELGPAFPFGFNARQVELSGGGGGKVSFKKIGIRLSILQLFLLGLGVNIDIEAANKGSLDVDLKFGILRLLAGKQVLPSLIELDAKTFPLDGLASYALKHVVASGAGGAMAGPLLGALAFRGSLNGDVSIELDSVAMSQSTGSVNLKFSDAALILSDPSIGLPDQVFKTAQIKGAMAAGALKIEPATRFIADELEIGSDGKINIKNSFMASDLDLKVIVKLTGGLGEKFGWVMDGLSGGASKGGNLSLQVRGTIGSPVASGL
ncbi:MAG: type II secretion system protein GspN [Proteobacteria bacterium]|nr:type II secretion system protein GspN [Pseudomonadota bacterium]